MASIIGLFIVLAAIILAIFGNPPAYYVEDEEQEADQRARNSGLGA